MKLSKAQTEVLEELKNAPLHSDVLEQEVYLSCELLPSLGLLHCVKRQ